MNYTNVNVLIQPKLSLKKRTLLDTGEAAARKVAVSSHRKTDTTEASELDTISVCFNVFCFLLCQLHSSTDETVL